jgi:hypothetical protein
MAPGIPNEKSRTVRPVHGPATIHLPLQVYALPFREASVLSLRYTTVFPARLPDIRGFPIAMAKLSTLSSISFINKHLETVSRNVRFMTHRNETIHINDLCLRVGFRSDDCHTPHTPHYRGLLSPHPRPYWPQRDMWRFLAYGFPRKKVVGVSSSMVFLYYSRNFQWHTTYVSLQTTP